MGRGERPNRISPHLGFPDRCWRVATCWGGIGIGVGIGTGIGTVTGIGFKG